MQFLVCCIDRLNSRPEAASQLAEMTHPNQPFISASEGQQVDFDSSHISNDWLIQW
jgi:hypothetical protein